ncbi:MAG TPA: transposase [Lacunisphaera sp.]|jgi:transposase-like protein
MLAAKLVPIERPSPDGKPVGKWATAELDRESETSAKPGQIDDWSLESGPRKIPRKNILLENQLKPAKARNFTPAGGILRRYYGRKSSVEETMLQLYHGNISVGKAEESVALLWGSKVGLMKLARSARIISRRISAWLQRELVVPQVYVFLQSIEIKQKTKNACTHSTIGAAVGIDRSGNRQLLALAHTAESSRDLWETLFSDLRKRGLHGTALFIGEIDPALCKAAGAYFPEISFQGCLLDFKNEIQRRVETPLIGFVWQAFEKIKSSSKQAEALQTTNGLLGVLRKESREDVAAIVQNWTASQFSYLHFTKSHWNKLREVGPFKQVLREFRETIRIIGPIADNDALIVMAAAKFRSMERVKWANQPFMTFGPSSPESAPAPALPATSGLKQAS